MNKSFQLSNHRAARFALVTTYGLKEGKYAGSIQSVVTGDDLFAIDGIR